MTSWLSSERGTLSDGWGVPIGSWCSGCLGWCLDCGGGGLVGGLSLDLLWVTVEEQIREDGPCLGSGESTSQTEDLSAEEVPDETDGVTRLVVGRDSDVDELQRGVSVTEGDDAG